MSNTCSAMLHRNSFFFLGCNTFAMQHGATWRRIKRECLLSDVDHSVKSMRTTPDCDCALCAIGKERRVSHLPFPFLPTNFMWRVVHSGIVSAEDVYGSKVSEIVWKQLTGVELSMTAVIVRMNTYGQDNALRCHIFQKTAFWLSVCLTRFVPVLQNLPALVIPKMSSPWEQLGFAYLMQSIYIKLIEDGFTSFCRPTQVEDDALREMRQICANTACMLFKSLERDQVPLVSIQLTGCFVAFTCGWIGKTQEPEPVPTPFYVRNYPAYGDAFHWHSLFLN